jgi:hypothetical protein
MPIERLEIVKDIGTAGSKAAPAASVGSEVQNDKSRRQSPRLFASSEKRKATGAGEGIRTLDPNLGKVVLYP